MPRCSLSSVLRLGQVMVPLHSICLTFVDILFVVLAQMVMELLPIHLAQSKRMS
jgi:hypothetical protein